MMKTYSLKLKTFTKDIFYNLSSIDLNDDPFFLCKVVLSYDAILEKVY